MDTASSNWTFAAGGCCKEGMVTCSFDVPVDHTRNCSRNGFVGFSGHCRRRALGFSGRGFPSRVSVQGSVPGESLSAGRVSSRLGVDRKYENLWRDLLSNPSQWWDNRIGKPNPRFPDFKHKQTGEGLWVMDEKNPPWVVSEIASIAPGVSIFSGAQTLSKYNKAGQFEKTMELFERMQKEGKTVDGYISVHVLNACAALQLLDEGRRLHQQIIETGCELSVYVGNSLIDMYGKCGSIEEAWRVFEEMPRRNVVSWNAMIMGFVKCGQGLNALELFKQMQQESVKSDSVTFVGLVNACASIVDLGEGRRIHEEIIRSGCEFNVYVGSSLVDMYGKCGSIEDAWRVFKKMPRQDVAGWNAMIMGYVKCGQGLNALELFQQMQQQGVEPNSFTFVGLLNACASIGGLGEGRQIHEQIIRSGYECSVHVGISLVDMYAKCGSIGESWRVFEKMPKSDIAGWNAMIMAFVKCGQGLNALELFQQMQQKGVESDSVTFVGLVNACASMADLEEGRRIHEQIIWSGFDCDVFVGNSLVDMYAKCGSIDDSWRVFEKMPRFDVVGWTAMIVGFVKCGQGLRALALFQEMQDAGVQPNAVTYVGVLNACASVAALETGQLIHRQILETSFKSDLFVRNSLIDMYCKCGSLDVAERLFDTMPTRDAASWNTMIMGFAMHGHSKRAVALFEQMVQTGAEIGEVTFICLLSACSHGGLVKEGMQYFDSMRSVYSVSPTREHYTCMIDLLGRAGHLKRAEEMIKTMPFEPSAAAWMALLGACRIHGNVEMGERASKQFLELEPTNASGYVLLSNIYAAAGNWDSKAMVHEQRQKNGVKKDPGRTWIEVNGEMHSFVANDRQHPQTMKIQEELSRLSVHMREAGYVPDVRFSLQDIEATKVVHLCGHSEKLAIAFGLINTVAGAPLRIVKNLRVCGDCHTATKFISKITGREITVRDGNRFHLFSGGLCSCGDYW